MARDECSRSVHYQLKTGIPQTEGYPFLLYRQYRTTPVRQIARKLNKVELRFFVRVHKFDAGGLTPGKENLCAMTENMQADDVQRRKPRVVRCCLYVYLRFLISSITAAAAQMTAAAMGSFAPVDWFWD